MDIAGLSMALSSVKVSNEISTAVLDMRLDDVKQAGENMNKVLESSVTPHLGQNIDIRA
ncbi:MAG: YjfB family protein [Lachnospiraceae bacterium]|nr:YjfB family protein [Lachnospiraceae bacterium]